MPSTPFGFTPPKPQAPAQTPSVFSGLFDRFSEWFTSPKTEELGIADDLDKYVQEPEKDYVRTPTTQIDPLKPVPNQPQGLVDTATSLLGGLSFPKVKEDNPVAQAASRGFDKGAVEGLSTPQTVANIVSLGSSPLSMVASPANLALGVQGLHDALDPNQSGFNRVMGGVGALTGLATGTLGAGRAIDAGIDAWRGMRVKTAPPPPAPKVPPPSHVGPADLTQATIDDIETQFPFETVDPLTQEKIPVSPIPVVKAPIDKALKQEFGMPDDPSVKPYRGKIDSPETQTAEMERLKAELGDVPPSQVDELEADFKLADKSADNRFKAYQDLKAADTVKANVTKLKDSGAKWSEPRATESASATVGGKRVSTSKTLEPVDPESPNSREVDLDMQGEGGGGTPPPSAPSGGSVSSNIDTQVKQLLKKDPDFYVKLKNAGEQIVFDDRDVASAAAQRLGVSVMETSPGKFRLIPDARSTLKLPTQPVTPTGNVPTQTFRTKAEAVGAAKKAGIPASLGSSEHIAEEVVDGKKVFKILVPDDTGGAPPKHPTSSEANAAHRAEIDAERRGAGRVAGSAEDKKYQLAREAAISKGEEARGAAAAATEEPVVPVEEPPAPPSSTTGSVPFMITQKMRADLLARGLSESDINKMTPQQAHDVLKTPVEAAAPPVEPSNTPAEELSPIDRFLAGEGDAITNTAPTQQSVIPIQALSKSKKDVAGTHYRQAQKLTNESGEKLSKKYRDDPTSGLSTTPRAQSSKLAGQSLFQMGKVDPNQELIGKVDEVTNLIKNQGGSDPERGALELMLAARMAGGLGGAAYGGATGDDMESRLRRAAVFGGLGAVAPDIVRNIPAAQKAWYLTRFPNIFINSWLGPWGAGLFGSAEHALANTDTIKKLADSIPMLEGGQKGDFPALTARGKPNVDYNWANEALKQSINPVKFLKGWKDAWPEAVKLGAEATERGEIPKSLAEAPSYIRGPLSAAGRAMMMGDMSTRNTLRAAGAPEKTARAITLTDEPSMAAAHKAVDAKRGVYSPTIDVVYPFVRTLMNQVEGTIERTPLLGVIAQYRFKNSKGFGTGPDPKNLILAQQVLGSGVTFAAAVLGMQIPPALVSTPVVGKLLSNFGAQYGGLAVSSFMLGQALQAGLPFMEAMEKTIMNTINSIPLPSNEPIKDTYKLITGGEIPSNPQAKSLIDLLLGENEEAQAPPSSFQFTPPEE